MGKYGFSFAIINAFEEIFKIMILNFQTLIQSQNERTKEEITKEKNKFEEKISIFEDRCHFLEGKIKEDRNQFEKNLKKLQISTQRLKQDKVIT